MSIYFFRIKKTAELSLSKPLNYSSEKNIQKIYIMKRLEKPLYFFKESSKRCDTLKPSYLLFICTIILTVNG